jgi:hypothetical protein
VSGGKEIGGDADKRTASSRPPETSMLESITAVAEPDLGSPGCAAAACSDEGSQTDFELDDDVAASPPPEVLEALDAAQAVQAELDRRGLSVSFDTDDAGRLGISIRDARGAQLRAYSPREALEALGGEDPLEELDR